MIRLLKILFEKHRQHFLTVAFIFGFIVDNLTLTRVDQLFDNAILLTYVFLAMGSLLFLYAGSAGKFNEKTNSALRRYAPLVTQYAFGGLFSGMLIFYGRSGSWMVSCGFAVEVIGPRDGRLLCGTLGGGVTKTARRPSRITYPRRFFK